MGSSRLIGAVVAAAMLLAAGCATRPAGPATHTWEPPCEKACPAGIVNFGEVSKGKIYRGAQPENGEAFRGLETGPYRIRTVVNLRHDHDDLELMPKDSKLKYVWIPMRPWQPEREQLVQFLAVVNNPANQPVFVHCAEGRDRTGYAIATQRRVAEGWPADDAIIEMFDYRFNPIWAANPDYLRALDVADVAARVSRAPGVPEGWNRNPEMDRK